MLQNNLDALAAWSKLWQLNIATDKTLIMHIGKHNPIHVYTVNSKAMSVINVIKDLGVCIGLSNDLTWNAHVTKTIKKANRLANTILHSFHCHDVNMHFICLCSQDLIIVALYGTQPNATILAVLKMYKKLIRDLYLENV